MNYTEIIKKIENDEGFIKNNNYHVIESTKETITIKAEITQNSMNPYGFVHGGFIFGLGDTVMGMLAATTEKKAVTMSANISYLKPAVGKYLIAKAEFLRCGKKACFLKTDIYNDKEEIVASMTGDFFFID